MSHLVLTRMEGERIMIADGLIVVEVVLINRDKVRLRISAPEDVSIDREEIFESKKMEMLNSHE